MTTFNSNEDTGYCQDDFGESPVVSELEDIFVGIPYKKLLETILLEKTRAFSPLGRLGYPLESLLRGVLASYYLGLKSTAHIVRRLQEDIILAVTSGFDPRNIPHRSTFSRFIKRLRKHQDLVDQCLNQTTSALKPLLPSFGEVVAVDSTPVRSHSNPWKEPPSDLEAGKIAKGGSGKDTEWHFGYRLHMVIDANYELPISKRQTLAKAQDVQVMIPLLMETRENLPWFHPRVVIADKGYDSKDNFEGVVKEFDADPIIAIKGCLPEVTGTPVAPTCPAGLPLIYRGWDRERGLRYECPEKAGKAVCPMLLKCGLKTIWIRPVHDYRRFGYCIKRGTDEWKELYRKRLSIERVNSRLKETRRLESHCFRGFDTINIHTTLSVLVMQAVALARARAGQIDEIRVCVRQVG